MDLLWLEPTKYSTVCSCNMEKGFCILLTAQVGPSLVVDHAGRQCAVVRWRGAEQDVVGHGLIDHRAV